MVLCVLQLTIREGRGVKTFVRRAVKCKAGLLRAIRRQRVREHKLLEALGVEVRNRVRDTHHLFNSGSLQLSQVGNQGVGLGSHPWLCACRRPRGGHVQRFRGRDDDQHVVAHPLRQRSSSRDGEPVSRRSSSYPPCAACVDRFGGGTRKARAVRRGRRVVDRRDRPRARDGAGPGRRPGRAAGYGTLEVRTGTIHSATYSITPAVGVVL